MRALLLVTGVMWLGGCAVEKNLVRCASFDLDCPEEQLSVTDLGGAGLNAPRGVSGCGRRATYLWDGQTGRWVMNSPRIDRVETPASERTEALRLHAAAEFECPSEELIIQPRESGRWAVVGCGRAATYRFDERVTRWIRTEPVIGLGRGALGELKTGVPGSDGRTPEQQTDERFHNEGTH